MQTVWRRDGWRQARQGVRVSSRRGYPSDLTDAQWHLVKDLLPEPSGDGRPEKHPRREIVNAILYPGPLRLPVAVPAGGSAALADRVLVLHPVGRRRRHREAARRAPGQSPGRAGP
jgi:hypothetical protein